MCLCVVLKGLVLVVCVYVWFLKDWFWLYVCGVKGLAWVVYMCVCVVFKGLVLVVCVYVWYLKD